MKLVKKDIEFDLFDSNFLSEDLINLLKSSTKIYLIPQSLFSYLKGKIDKDQTLNNNKYWISCLDLYSSILNGINHATHLKNINYNYNIIIKEWQNENILENKRGYFNYETGKTFTYKFEETNSYCFVSFITEDNKIKESIDVELDDYYKETLLNCDIDIEKAIYHEYINKKSIPLFIKRVSLILDFLGKRYIKKGKRVDRWYNSFSSLTKISRKYIKLNNKYFYEMDLSNAQPTLLCKYLMDLYDIFDENYIKSTSNGEFYESLMNKAIEMGIEGEMTWEKDLGCQTWKSFNNRQDVKKLCYQNIFFAQNTRTKTFKIFNELYPNTWRLLSMELNNGDEKLASILQNMEADIFLNIKPKCNYFTVHDAIYISDKSFSEYVYNRVKELMGSDLYILTSDFDKQDENRIDYDVSIDKVGDVSLFIIDDVDRKPHKQHKQHKQHSNSNKDEILRLKSLGWNIKQITEELKISRKTYYKWIK